MEVKEMMKAAVLDPSLSLEIKELPVPVPAENEALIQVKCIGICGSDIHYYEHGKIGRYKVKEPLILGHEAAGKVVALGKNATNLNIGDRVAIEPGVSCGICDNFKQGRYNLCPSVEFLATPPIDGAWTEYVAVRSDFLHLLPSEMSYEEGALLEPFSVAYHAMRRAKITPGSNILIQGLGPIGLLTIQAVKLFGIGEIYASDVVDYRLKKAKELGVTEVINVKTENLQEKIMIATNEIGLDCIIETSGNEKAITDTIHLAKRGGQIVFVGLPPAEEAMLNISEVVDKELDLYGSFRFANTFQKAIQAIQNRNIDLKTIITDSYPLTDIDQAIKKAIDEKDTSIKIMIYP